MILIDAQNTNEIKEQFSTKSRPIVTLDYDDTFVEKTGKFKHRNELFFILCQTCDVWFVTSRQLPVYPTEFAYDDMVSYLEDMQLDVRGIVYNAGDKEVLALINPICHFEDDLYTTIRVTRLGVPVWYAGEMLDEEHVQDVCKIFIEQDIAKWYTHHSVFTPTLLKLGGEENQT